MSLTRIFILRFDKNETLFDEIFFIVVSKQPFKFLNFLKISKLSILVSQSFFNCCLLVFNKINKGATNVFEMHKLSHFC